jgi:site-specific DNA recombinase
MYVDKLDSRIDAAFFDRKAAEWRAEQDRLLRAIEDHRTANRTYLDEGIKLLDLARRAHTLFMRQEPREKRRLLNFIVSNCTWKDGSPQATSRQPFDMLAISTRPWDQVRTTAGAAAGLGENWLPGLGSNQRLPD